MTLVVQSNTISVWVGPADGSPVDRSDPTHAAPFLTPMTVSRGLGSGGGSRLDWAGFDYNLAMTGEAIANISTPLAGFSRQVEIHWEQGGGAYTPIFWGDLTQQETSVGRQATATVRGAIYPYHFGVPFKGPLYYDLDTSVSYTIEEPIEFNPIIDGQIEGNMSSLTEGALSAHLWIDPESVRTSEAEFWQGASASKWTLQDAVVSVLYACNESESFIKNPTALELPTGLANVTLENVTFDPHQYLPYYLDGLLHPYGYDWGVYLSVESGATVKTIRIIERGAGTEKTLKQQPPGETLNLVSVGSYTDTEEWSVMIDIGGAYNKVTVLGGYKQYEATFTLFKGWSDSDDGKPLTDLAIDDDTSQYHTGSAHVGRLWVANEAGDYIGLRVTNEPSPTEPPDWSAYGVKNNRRRRFERPLSFDAGTGLVERMEPLLEFTLDAGVTWQPVPPEWSYRVLEDQCGVIFTGNTPPEELYMQEAKLRITATITGDERLQHTSTDTDGNCPNGRDHELVVEMPDSFALREVVTTPAVDGYTEGSKLQANGHPSHAIDDTTKIEAFADATLDREVSGMIDGRYQLIGVRFDYELGDLITKIAGREVSLNRNATGGTTSKYPQITGIVWHPQDQVTQLETAAFESEYWYRRNQSHNSRYAREV